jgi:hypothetical protein
VKCRCILVPADTKPNQCVNPAFHLTGLFPEFSTYITMSNRSMTRNGTWTLNSLVLNITQSMPWAFRLHTRARTLGPWFLPLLEAPAEGFLYNHLDFGRRILFEVLDGCESYPLEIHFQVREQANFTWNEIRRLL